MNFDALVTAAMGTPAVAASGHAEVFQARWQQRLVAVKLMRQASTPDMMARFIQEAQLLSALNHAALVPFIAAGQYCGRPYLVTSWIDGTPLDKLIWLNPAGLPWPRIRKLASAIADGLEVLHQAGVVHRDIKPSNIVLGPDDKPVILDLGHAKVLDISARLTATGHAVGTLAYMSPEQARGEPITPRADLYALGKVILALHGTTPPMPAVQDLVAWMLADAASARLPSAKVLKITLSTL